MILDFIFLWKELSADNMLSMYSNLARQYVSSTNLLHSFTLFLKFSITDVSGSTMNIFTSTEPNGETIYLNVSFIIKCKKYIFCAED